MASHSRIALEGIALRYREDQDNLWATLISFIKLLLVLSLRGPDVMLHGLDDVVAIIASDYEEAGF